MPRSATRAVRPTSSTSPSPRLAKGGEVTLAGFYDRLSFAFPPAFMREARLRIAAEFTPADIAAVIALIDIGAARARRADQPRAPRRRGGGRLSAGLHRPRLPEDGPRLENAMSMFDPGPLREEASFEPDPVPTGPVTKETQIIAIYGKGGSGKSFALANLSYMMAQQGKRVLLIGCDPKSDTTSLLFGGKSTPTIIETSRRRRSWPARRSGSRTSASSATACSRWSWAGPRSAAAAAGAASSTASRRSRSWASTNGASTTSCSISWATWCAAASACRSRATCARR